MNTWEEELRTLNQEIQTAISTNGAAISEHLLKLLSDLDWMVSNRGAEGSALPQQDLFAIAKSLASTPFGFCTYGGPDGCNCPYCRLVREIHAALKSVAEASARPSPDAIRQISDVAVKLRNVTRLDGRDLTNEADMCDYENSEDGSFVEFYCVLPKGHTGPHSQDWRFSKVLARSHATASPSTTCDVTGFACEVGGEASARPSQDDELAYIASLLVGFGINRGGLVRDGVRELGRQFQMLQGGILDRDARLAARPPSEDFRQCGYCNVWATKPCGEQCVWSPDGKTVEQVRGEIPRPPQCLFGSFAGSAACFTHNGFVEHTADGWWCREGKTYIPFGTPLIPRPPQAPEDHRELVEQVRHAADSIRHCGSRAPCSVCDAQLFHIEQLLRRLDRPSGQPDASAPTGKDDDE